MKRLAHIFSAALIAVTTTAFQPLPSFARSTWYTSLPGCEEAKVLDNIIRRYNEADRTLWYEGVRMRSISHSYERPGTNYPALKNCLALAFQHPKSASPREFW